MLCEVDKIVYYDSVLTKIVNDKDNVDGDATSSFNRTSNTAENQERMMGEISLEGCE